METIQAIVKSWQARKPADRRKAPREKWERRAHWEIVGAAIQIVERNTFFNDVDKARIIKELQLLKD